jgi:hypothetical protein
MSVFWDVASCSLVEVYRRCLCLHRQGIVPLIMEAAATSETSADLFQHTQQTFQEDRHLVSCCRENLKSHIMKIYFILKPLNISYNFTGNNLGL